MPIGSPTPAESGPPVLDTAVLRTLEEQLGEDIDGLVSRFERRLVETGPAVEASLAADDRLELTRQAHSLKSVSATFGAAAVARSSAGLEACAGGAEPPELEAAVARLASECLIAREAIAGWLSSRGT